MRQAIRPAAEASGNRWWRGLAARSTATVGILLAGLAVMLTATVAVSVRSATIEAIEAEMVLDADHIAADLQSTPFAGSHSEALAAKGYVYVVAADGSLISGSKPVETTEFSGDALAKARREGGSVVIVANGYANVAKSIEVDGAPATLHIGRSLSTADDAAFAAAARGVVASLGFLAFALPAAALMTDRAAAPLRTLTRAVTRPGRAHDALDLANGRRDEIGASPRASRDRPKSRSERGGAPPADI